MKGNQNGGSVCLQVLLRQEHHDEGSRQEVRVQVRFPGSGSRDAAGGGRSGGVQVPERVVHVRLRSCQAEPDAAAGSVGFGFRSRRPLSIGIELLVDEPGRQLVCRPSHGLRTRATSSRHLSALRMTRRRALGRPGHAALKHFYRKSTSRCCHVVGDNVCNRKLHSLLFPPAPPGGSDRTLLQVFARICPFCVCIHSYCLLLMNGGRVGDLASLFSPFFLRSLIRRLFILKGNSFAPTSTDE